MKMMGVPKISVFGENSRNDEIQGKECPVERSLRLINLSNDKLTCSIITSNLLQAGMEPAYLIRMIESSE